MFGEFPVTKMLAELEHDDLLPAILFRTSRRQCDMDIEKLQQSRVGVLPHDRQRHLAQEVQKIITKYEMDAQVLLKHVHYQALITTGSGAHHAGQLLLWRLMLEELMSRGMLRLMIATGTVAAGVDFPARSVIITAHSKRGSEGFNMLTASEFQQMSGRAGRRGKDAVGICLVAPGAYSDARVIHQVIQRPPEPLRSAYFAAPATVLNLLKYRNVDDLKYTVSRSLAAFLDRKAGKKLRQEAQTEEQELKGSELSGESLKKAQKRCRRKVKDAAELEAKQEILLAHSLAGLEKLGHLQGSGLTEKGYWAANLCTSLVLEIAEAIDSHIFSDLSVYELVGLVASIAGDPHRPYFGLKANPIKKELFSKMNEVIQRVKASFDNPMTSEVAVLPEAAVTVISWMDSENWESFSGLLRLAGVAEGDVARLVTQTADHLNQISRLEESHPDLARLAAEGRSKILKPPLTESWIAAIG